MHYIVLWNRWRSAIGHRTKSEMLSACQRYQKPEDTYRRLRSPRKWTTNRFVTSFIVIMRLGHHSLNPNIFTNTNSYNSNSFFFLSAICFEGERSHMMKIMRRVKFIKKMKNNDLTEVKIYSQLRSSFRRQWKFASKLTCLSDLCTFEQRQPVSERPTI